MLYLLGTHRFPRGAAPFFGFWALHCGVLFRLRTGAWGVGVWPFMHVLAIADTLAYTLTIASLLV